MSLPAQLLPPETAHPPSLVARPSMSGWPWLDSMALGGVSVLVPLAILGYSLQLLRLSTGLQLLSNVLFILFVGPHYWASYEIFYLDQGSRLRSDWRHVLVGFVLPAAVLGLLVETSLNSAFFVDSRLANTVMNFFASIHYNLQVFGTTLVMMSLNKVQLSGGDKGMLKKFFLAFALLTFFLPFALQPGGAFVFGAGALTMACFLAAGILAYKLKHIFGGMTPGSIPAVATLPLVSLLVWTAPVLFWSQSFQSFRNIPFVATLHCIQYLLFAVCLRNFHHRTSLSGPGPSRWRLASQTFVIGILFGLTVTTWLPGWMHSHWATDRSTADPLFYYALVWVFVNLHHYGIDALIWRRENRTLQNMVKFKAGAFGIIN
jgi:hypothetical protein